MRLTNFSDISLRVLLYAAAHPDRLVTIDEMLSVFGVSKGQMIKVVHNLTTEGFLVAQRGRLGGLSLGHPPADIRLGQVLRKTETDFGMVECMRTGNQCVLTGNCKLPLAINEAISAFMGVLDDYTLEDMQLPSKAFPKP